MAPESPDKSRERLRRLLGGPALSRLRTRLRERFERGGPPAEFTLTALEPAERAALEGLLGRRGRAAASFRVRLAELDAALREAGVAPDLRTALDWLDGPLRDLVAERIGRNAAWQTTFAGVRDERLRALLAAARGRALVKRLAGGIPARADDLLAGADRVLARLPAAGVPLARLAAEALGDSHALDPGARVAAVVLRASGAVDRGDRAAPESDLVERTRDRWARLGVVVNELARPVLALNLVATCDSPCGRLARAAPGEPVYFSLRALLRTPPQWDVRGRTVYVCENPTVVAIASDALGADSAPLVCTDGMPAAAQRTLLDQLVASGARLRHHGDFDWAGLAIGNVLVERHGATPWRFTAADYEAACEAAAAAGGSMGALPATGAAVAASWDAALAPALRRRATALHEEQVVESLLADLRTRVGSPEEPR